VGYKRMGLFCLVTMPTLIRDTWQHPFQTFRQVARTTIIFLVSAAHPCRVRLWTIGQQVGNSEKCHAIEHYHCADSCNGKLLGTAT
jgi:hypothetical protein